MDTGSDGTFLPAMLADKLGIEEPPENEDYWMLINGVSGMSVGFRPTAPITVTLTGMEEETFSTDIFPMIHVCCAPAFSAVRDHKTRWGERHYWPKAIAQAVSLPFSMAADGFHASVKVPDEDCPILSQRPRILRPADEQEFALPLILGRDWQKAHTLVFKETTLTIS